MKTVTRPFLLPILSPAESLGIKISYV